MFALEGFMNVQEAEVQKLWKFYSEENKLEKPSLAGHLLLLQLNILHNLLRM